MIKYKTLLILVLVSSCFFTTCKKNIFSKIKYEGTVYDSLGGNPSANVKVRLSACVNKSAKSQCTTYEVGSCTTSASGHFIIKATAARSNRYAVFIDRSDVYTGFDLTKSDLTSSRYTILYLKEK